MVRPWHRQAWDIGFDVEADAGSPVGVRFGIELFNYPDTAWRIAPTASREVWCAEMPLRHDNGILFSVADVWTEDAHLARPESGLVVLL